MSGIKYSLAVFNEFCKSLGSLEGKSPTWATIHRSACNVVLKDLSPDERADVREIDVDAAIARYSNTKTMKPKTIRAYRNRIKTTIAEFTKHLGKDAGSGQTLIKNAGDSSPSDEIGDNDSEQETAKRPVSNTLQIPIRSNFLAQLILPFDLTHLEAKRLSTLILNLPMMPEDEGENSK